MSWIDGVRHRLRTSIHPRAYARETADERRFHLEMERLHGRTGGASTEQRRPEMPTPDDGSSRRRRSRSASFLEAFVQDLG